MASVFRNTPQRRSLLAHPDGFSNEDYRNLFSVTRRAATQELRRLVAEGFLVLEGERRGAQYRPGPAIERELEE